MAISFSGASSARKSSCANSTPGLQAFQQIDRDDLAFAIALPMRLAATWLQRRRSAEIDHRDTLLEEAILVVDLDQL